MSSNPIINNGWFPGFIYFVINRFLCMGWELGRRRFWRFWGRFFPWVLEAVGLDDDDEDSEEMIDLGVSDPNMEGNASLITMYNPTVINTPVRSPTAINGSEVSGPTRIS
jgi:hypothetical protein